MAQQGNPYFVDPSQGGDARLGLMSNIGDTLKENRAKRQTEAVEAEFQQAAANNDVNKMLEISSTNPQFQKFANQQANWQNEKEREETIKSLARFTQAKTPEEKQAALVEGFDSVSLVGGDSGDFVQLTEAFLRSPEEAAQMADAALITYAPDIYKQLHPREQKLADRRTTAEKNYDRYKEIEKSQGKKAADEFYDQQVMLGRGSLKERTDESIRGEKGKSGIRVDEAGEKAKNLSEQEMVSQDIQAGRSAIGSMANLNDLEELIKTTKTGGVYSIGNRISNMLGLKGNEDEAEIASRSGDLLLAELQKLTGAVSDADLAVVKSLITGIEKSGGANLAIIKKYKDLAESLIKKGNRASKHSKFGSEYYRSEFDDYFGADAPASQPTTKTINWGEM